MVRFRIPSGLRSEVIERAKGRCEYCQVLQEAELIDYEIDHVIAEQHGGKAELANLAYACFDCNHYKGPNLASIDPQKGKVTRLFNPRTQKWGAHFQLNDDGTITPRTAAGRVTTRLLRFNDSLRVQQRVYLIRAGKLRPKATQS